MYPKLLAGLTIASAGFSKMSPCEIRTLAMPLKYFSQALTTSASMSRNSKTIGSMSPPQPVAWVAPPGPAFGRPDDKLRGRARICPASKRYPSIVFAKINCLCEDDGFREGSTHPTRYARVDRSPGLPRVDEDCAQWSEIRDV